MDIFARARTKLNLRLAGSESDGNVEIEKYKLLVELEHTFDIPVGYTAYGSGHTVPCTDTMDVCGAGEGA